MLGSLRSASSYLEEWKLISALIVLESYYWLLIHYEIELVQWLSTQVSFAPYSLQSPADFGHIWRHLDCTIGGGRVQLASGR